MGWVLGVPQAKVPGDNIDVAMTWVWKNALSVVCIDVSKGGPQGGGELDY